MAEVESVFYPEEERDWAEPRSDELLAAARLVGPQPRATLKPILEAVRGVRRRDRPELDRVSEEAMSVIEDMHDEPPYMQGYELASWVRLKRRATYSGGRINPSMILKSWGVPVIDADLGVRTIDAIGCWGPSHGPAVLLNSDAGYSASSGRGRATLAHEICHLLVDREISLPLVEVLGGRTAKHVEQRARAFAAELLLPRDIAGRAFLDSEGAEARTVSSLRSRFGVSTELLAWQVKNSGHTIAPSGWQFLAHRVPNPSEFGRG